MKAQLLLTAALVAAVMLWLGFLESQSNLGPAPERSAPSEAASPSSDPGQPDGPEIATANEAAAAISPPSDLLPSKRLSQQVK